MSEEQQRGWFKFSLKTLLVVMTLLAVVLGLSVKSFRDRQDAIAAIHSLNGSISFKRSGPQWLRRFVTDEKYFLSPVAVRFSPRHPLTDLELNLVIGRMLNFDDLTYVNLYQSEITDNGLAELLPLADKLESLDVRSTGVSDQGILHLKQFRRLTLLRIKDSAISAAGIEEVRKSLPSCKLDVQ